MRQLLEQFGAGFAADLDQEIGGSSPSSSSVRARSKPEVAFGPVRIETQKQVPPACPQLTATMKASCRRIAYAVVRIGPVAQHSILNGDRVDLAGAHAEERQFRTRRDGA